MNFKSISLFLIVGIFFATLQSTVLGYSIDENNFELDENSTKVETFKISIVTKSNKSPFPKTIKIQLKVLGQNREVILDKISSKSKRHPISERDVYTLDKVSKRFVRQTDLNDDSLQHAFYHDRTDSCVATVFKSDDETFKMLGTCIFDNHVYHIVPIASNNKRKKRDAKQGKSNTHGIFKRHISSLGLIDSIKTPDDASSESKRNVQENRQKRQSSSAVNLVVETLIVVDYSTYLDHKRITGIEDKNTLIKYMRIYFTQLINGVNQKYLNTFQNDNELFISVKIKNFIFGLENDDSIWTNRDKVGVADKPTYNNKEVVNSDSGLKALSEYVNSKTLSFTFDHVAGFTNKDLWSASTSITDDQRSMNAGLAYLAKACDEKYKYSINEDSGLFNGISIMAHELAHNLGSDHDGEGGIYADCPSSDGYLMSPILKNGPNLSKFSPCTVKAIKSYVLSSGAVSSAAACLASTAQGTIPESNLVKQRYPGQSWTADDQCKNLFNKFGSFCLSLSKNICTNLYCRSNPKNTVCTTFGGAAEGTPCGDGKMCINNECVDNTAAPKGDCVHGDEPFIQIYSNIEPTTCEDFIEKAMKNNGYSNNPCISNANTQNRCCMSCRVFKNMNCFDKYSNCPTDFKASCATDAGSRADCPKTCGVCSGKITCDNVSNICMNGGTCKNTNSADDKIAGFECSCPQGYSGRYCQDKNPCDPNPCENGKTCTRLGSKGYFCDYDIQ